MPDWNNKKYSPIRELLKKFISSINNIDFILLNECFSDDIVMCREETFKSKIKVINWYKKMIPNMKNLKFKLIDTSAGFFSEFEVQVILYIEIYQNNKKKELLIESLNIKYNNKWEISQLFGLSFEPDSHKKYW